MQVPNELDQQTRVQISKQYHDYMEKSNERRTERSVYIYHTNDRSKSSIE